MNLDGLPKASDDLLKIPPREVPDLIHSLLEQRSLSTLVQEIHREMVSRDPALRKQARKALRHLGFPE